MTNKDEIADLKRELAALKQAVAPPSPDVAARQAAEYAAQVHAMRERRASAVPSWLRDAVAGGVTDADAQGIVRAGHAPMGPSSEGAIPSSQTLSSVRPGGGSGGWAREIPLSSPPGVAQADRLMDEQDRRDRVELVEREAKFIALQKLAEQKP